MLCYVNEKVGHDGVGYADFLDAYVLGSGAGVLLLDTNTLEASILTSDVPCAALDVDSERKTVICPENLYTNVIRILDLSSPSCYSSNKAICLFAK